MLQSRLLAGEHFPVDSLRVLQTYMSFLFAKIKETYDFFPFQCSFDAEHRPVSGLHGPGLRFGYEDLLLFPNLLQTAQAPEDSSFHGIRI